MHFQVRLLLSIGCLALALGAKAAAAPDLGQAAIPLASSGSIPPTPLAPSLILPFPHPQGTDIPGPPQPLPPADAATVVILDYHTFLGSKNSGIDFSLSEFAAQLDAIAAMGYRFVNLDEALSGRLTGNANILITIDDGNHSIWQAYFEVMKPRGIKPVFFVYPAIILGGISYAITPDRLVELAKEGCPIGAHGYHHNPVTDKAWSKDPKDFMMEIKKPGKALARILGVAPTWFGYPFGVYSIRAEEGLKAEGYAWAFAADEKVIPVDFTDPRLDHYAVPRTIMYRWNSKLVLGSLANILKRP